MEQLSLFDELYPRYFLNENKKTRLITLFSGYDSQKLAFNYLGKEVEHYRVCEFDKYAINTLNEIHNTNFKTTDIKSIGAEFLNIVEKDKYNYIMTYSFPCFTGDSLVLTNSGYKRIDEIKIGDYVLTHQNKYQKVLNFYSNGIKPIYQIRGMAIDEIKTTKNHKFLVRTRYRKWNNFERTYLRLFEQPKWKEVGEISKDDYLGISINQNSIIPIWNGINFEWRDGRKTRHKNELNKYMDNKIFWWIVGRYIGDGWLRNQGGIIICCDKNETDEIESKLQNLFNYSISKERTVNKIHIPLKELGYFCEQFGKGAKNKRLTNTIIDLPIDLLESFINGYESADGYVCAEKHRISSISRELIYGIGQCIAKVYKTPYKIYSYNRGSKCYIEGRECNINKIYEIVYKKEKCKQDKAFYENGYIWYPISSIEYIGEENVYDIEIENDHSFTVQNTIVHNCTDLSIAGKRQGMERDSGTRSGLLWEVERLLKETKELPDVLIMENVPQVLKANGWYEWCEFLENLGYNNYVEVINAKRFGIPQNRERCFMVSILGDYSYNFPKGFELKYRLKDLLEKNVDEKYYLSVKMLNCFLNPSESGKKFGRTQQFLNNLNKEVGATITTLAGQRATDNYLIENEEYDYYGKTMKQKLCNDLIKNGVREEYQGMYQYNKSDNFMNGKDRFTKNKELSDTILTQPKEGVVVKVGNYSPSGHNAASIVDSEGIAPTVMENHGTVTATVVNAEINPKLVGGIGDKKSNGGTQWYQQDRVYDSESIAMCHCANIPSGSYNYQLNDLRIRKLTPKECFRLMGVKDTDYNKITCSNAQKYKQAGNSIVTTCLMAIYSQLYKDCDYKSKIDDLLKELTTSKLRN